MTTSFPTGLDSYTRPLTTDPLNSPSHAGVHDNAYDAIEALEAKVGVDASAVTTSLDYLVKVLRATSVATKTADYTLVDTDGVILVDAAGAVADITMTLPTASGIAGKTYIIKRIDADFDFNVVIDGNGTETIDGELTQTLYFEDEMVRLVSDGTNWRIIGRDWGKIHRVRLRRNAALSVSANNDNQVFYNSTAWGGGSGEQEDVGDLHSDSSTTARATIKRPGWYRCTAWVKWASDTSNVRRMAIALNGATVFASPFNDERTSGGRSFQTLSADIYMGTAGDYVEQKVWHNSTTSPLDAEELHFYVRWVPPTS